MLFGEGFMFFKEGLKPLLDTPVGERGDTSFFSLCKREIERDFD
jgi:hypothetical protein